MRGVMDYDALFRFLLLSLLLDGKSNMIYRLSCFLLGKRKGTFRYFKKMFAGCDLETYHFICMRYKELYKEDFILPGDYFIQLDDRNILTGELLRSS